MPQQVINNGESGLSVRNKLNSMFAELYGNTPVPIKLPGVSGNVSQLLTGNTFLSTLEVGKVSGTPILKVGTTPGGEDLLPSVEIVNFMQSNTQLYCATSQTIYFTLSGGTINIRLDIINNYL